MNSHTDTFKKAIEEFNSERFHDAHDTLEEFWTNYHGEDRKYYQAWIQICVALHLASEGRDIGAKKVLERARKNLEGYKNELSFMDLESLFQETASRIAARHSTQAKLAPPLIKHSLNDLHSNRDS